MCDVGVGNAGYGTDVGGADVDGASAWLVWAREVPVYVLWAWVI